MAFKNFSVRNGLEVEGSVILSGSTSGTTEIKAAADALGIYTLPSALPTASGQVLTSTDLGVTSWSPALTTTGGDVTLAAPTGGSNTVIVTADQRIEVTRTTATTNAAVNTLQLRADSSGTPTVGFGTSLLYQVETAIGTFKDAATINVQSTDVTTSSEDFRMNFALMENGATVANRLSLFSNGNLEMSDGGKLFIQGATNGYTALGAPATGSNITYTLPGADGTSGQVLSTNGSGTLSWATASGGGGSTIPIANSGTNTTHPWSLGPGVLLSSNGTTGTMAAQVVRYQPIYVTEACTLTEVAITVGGTAPTSCSAMIYIENCSPNSATEWQPTSHLSGGYCGEISITSTGQKTITGLSISLAPGAYLIAVQSNNFTGTLTLGHYGGQVLTGNGYTINATTATTAYSWARTGVAYTSGTPAAVGDFTHQSSPTAVGLVYTVFTKFAKA